MRTTSAPTATTAKVIYPHSATEIQDAARRIAVGARVENKEVAEAATVAFVALTAVLFAC